MIIFILLTLSAGHARQVTNLVVTEQLATDAFLDEAIGNYYLTANGTVTTEPLYRVISLTKALLYHRIEDLLERTFPHNDFRMYTTPVTPVNDAGAERVRWLHRV